MDKNSFAQMMNRPGRLSPEEWDELHRERDRYPFSAPLQVLSLLADKAGGAPLWERQALPYVSLYVPDVEWLYAQGAAPLKDFDGPVYLRASEAELKLNGTIS